MVRSYYYTHGLPITITNCSNNYGPFQDPEKLIPRFITNLIQGEKVPVYGDGLQIRDWLYVEDHCRAIDLVLVAGKPGTTYCVGGQRKLYSNLEITKQLLKLTGRSISYIEHVADRKGHDRKYAVDWTKINRELGWEPQRGLEEGLRTTILWYKKILVRMMVDAELAAYR